MTASVAFTTLMSRQLNNRLPKKTVKCLSTFNMSADFREPFSSSMINKSCDGEESEDSLFSTDQSSECSCQSSTPTSPSSSKTNDGSDDELLSLSNMDEANRRDFVPELIKMMYGFGDDKNPFIETVEVLEDLVVQYITTITSRALETSRSLNQSLDVEHILHVVRHQPEKYARALALVSMNEELKKARKAFDIA